MPEDFDPQPEDILSTTPKALEVRSIDDAPYPMLAPEDLIADLVDRTVVWVASQHAGTEKQLIMAAGMVLHKAATDCAKAAMRPDDN